MSERFGYEDVLTITAMVAMECVEVGLKTLYKAATLKGMSYYAFIVYSHIIATLLFLPAPFFSHRSRALPPLRFSTLFKIGLLGLIGSSSQIMGYSGINYSSPTLSSAISNLTPAFTFILAVILRMEKLALKRASSVAKVLGTVVSVTGAFLVTLYKGPSLITKSPPHLHQLLHESSNSNWEIGGAFLTTEAILLSFWYIFQAQILNEYPAKLAVVCLFNFCVTFMVAMVGAFNETDANAWMISPDISLLSIVCSGLFRSGMYTAVHAWALQLKGPVFVAMFKPLSIVIAIAMGYLLGDSLHAGSLIGGLIISIGFYVVMWGKAKETMGENFRANSSEPPANSREAPLLKSCDENTV